MGGGDGGGRDEGGVLRWCRAKTVTKPQKPHRRSPAIITIADGRLLAPTIFAKWELFSFLSF